MNLPHTATIRRKMAIEGKGQSKAFQQVATGVRCMALPVTPKDALAANLTVGKDYNIFFDLGANVQEGDEVTVSIGVKLYINGLVPLQVGRVGHIEGTATTTGS